MKTIIENKFDKVFGPVGSFAGVVLLISGIGLSYFNLGFIILVLFGAFVGFTNTSTSINTNTMKARLTSNWFGIIKTGKWINLNHKMQAKVLRNNKSFRAYSRGNRELVVKTHAFKVALFDKNMKEIISLKYFNDLPSGKIFEKKINAILNRN